MRHGFSTPAHALRILHVRPRIGNKAGSVEHLDAGKRGCIERGVGGQIKFHHLLGRASRQRSAALSHRTGIEVDNSAKCLAGSAS